MGTFASTLIRAWEDWTFSIRMRLGTIHHEHRTIVITSFPREFITGPTDEQELEAMQYAARFTSVSMPRLRRTYQRPDGLYIATEVVEGERLDLKWPHLSTEERREIIKLVYHEIRKLQACKPPPGMDIVVASIGGGPIQAGGISRSPTGPCRNLEDFEAAVAKAPMYWDYRARIATLKSRGLNSTVFVNASIVPGSIMLRRQDGRPVLMDWGSSGWFPAYWENVRVHFADFPVSPGWTEMMDEAEGLEEGDRPPVDPRLPYTHLPTYYDDLEQRLEARGKLRSTVIAAAEAVDERDWRLIDDRL